MSLIVPSFITTFSLLAEIAFGSENFSSVINNTLTPSSDENNTYVTEITTSTSTFQDFISLGDANVTRNATNKRIESKTCKVGNGTFIYDNEFAFQWQGCWLILCIYDPIMTVKPGIHFVPCDQAYRHFGDLGGPDNLYMVESDCEKCTGKPQEDPMKTKKWYQWILPIPGK